MKGITELRIAGTKKIMKKLMLTFFVMSIYGVATAAPQTKLISGEDLLTNMKLQISSEGKKGLVVVFLSARCPCSNSHNTELRELAEKYKEFNFVAVHSNTEEGKEISIPYFKGASFPFPVIEDQNTKLADQLQAFKTPHSFVFSPEGKPLFEGGVSNSSNCATADRKYLREALEDLQAGKPVRTPEGRTLGCVITRKE